MLHFRSASFVDFEDLMEKITIECNWSTEESNNIIDNGFSDIHWGKVRFSLIVRRQFENLLNEGIWHTFAAHDEAYCYVTANKIERILDSCLDEDTHINMEA